MAIKIIITGATGMVGEGVLLACLAHPEVSDVLMVNRKTTGMQHPKLKELLVPNFMQLDGLEAQLSGYNACFYCAGITSNGMTEADYTHITYDIPLNFAHQLLSLNTGMVFSHISGGNTDSTEQGKIMWARVKGKAENALMRLPFKKVYNLRPGFMKPTRGQKNIKGYYHVVSFLFPVLHLLLPSYGCTIQQLGQAMINTVLIGYPKQILEVKDIKALAGE